MLTRASETLNYHPRAAVHWNAAILNFMQTFDHKQLNKHTDRPTNSHY